MKVEEQELDGITYLKFDRGPSLKELGEEIKQRRLGLAPQESRRYPEGTIFFNLYPSNIFAGEDCEWFADAFMVNEDHKPEQVTFASIERLGPCCFAFVQM